MKHLHALLLASAALTAATGALATEPGGYVGFGAGIHIPQTSNVLVGGAAREMDFENGPIFVGSAGYKWDQGFRTELEFGYREGSVGNVTPATGVPVAWTGQQRTWSTMANILFDIGTSSSGITPYIGAGAGLSWIGWKDSFKGPTTPAFDGTDSRFSWQGIAGVSYDATSNLGLFLEYRYIGANNGRFPAKSAPATVVADHDDRSHNLLAGFRWSFGAPPKPAPAPVAAPAPAPAPVAKAPPPPPAIPQKFLVFFDFDKSNLRADAQKIVSDAAEYAKKNGKARITTTGHADTSGTPAYNLALSERRAKAVKAELARLGISEREIVVLFKGESEPLVATGDGVKEPQNRRVEIVMD
ncbi:MAG: outer membrane beta-barrel protein [Rhodospirillaceae bacterium]|nr:outer membrane beta-barrel protein [Rhodospirillaceae bacterium]